jgi:hypothetical protein
MQLRNYHEEATRIRAAAANLAGAARAQLLEIANLYDRLADTAEKPDMQPSGASGSAGVDHLRH